MACHSERSEDTERSDSLSIQLNLRGRFVGANVSLDSSLALRMTIREPFFGFRPE